MLHGSELAHANTAAPCVSCLPAPPCNSTVPRPQGEFDLTTELEDLIHSLGPRAHGQGLELVCRIPPGLPARFVGAPAPLLGCVALLIENAVRVTQRGEIVVVVTSETGEALRSPGGQIWTPDESAPGAGDSPAPSVVVTLNAITRHKPAPDPTEWDASVTHLVEALGAQLAVPQESGQRRRRA